ncbi:GNAT family N-acetyltransferase [Streptomyces sp. Je 1-369]|uniref:GNAT family N-acetyltransferase n=1 Tax=Streptomyces sp. Je 1-369 TaxID=2966192 RepID=UPI0022855867|nr:GNAT family N-acetyltransferase [Streptomyces sp. Je 1-369]WAL97656.1 GNAT family N-acetyltransferase [Streptomyces sp. Je 1-369]
MNTPDTAGFRLARYTKADQQEILGTGEDPFGVAETGLAWLPKEDHFGIRHDGRLIAHAGLRRLPVTVDGSDLTEVIGVGGVAVAPDVRGHGLARRVIATALAHATTLGPPHALLFCRPPLVPLYERLGWQAIPPETPVRVEQPGDRVITMPLRTMVTPLHEGARWPEGPLRLRSLPM